MAQSPRDVLAMINRHILASERNIAEQRHRVRLIERNGGDVSLSRSILKNLEDSLRLHHEHRDLLVAGDTGLQRDQKEVSRPIANSASFAEILDVLVRTAMQQTEGDARAAFYIADAGGAALYHVIGMPQAYAKHVDAFQLALSRWRVVWLRPPDDRSSPAMLSKNHDGSRGCGSPRSSIIVLVGRFQSRLRQERCSGASRCITKSHAKQHSETLISPKH